MRAAQLRGRGSTLPNSGALVCLPTTLKAFDPACPNVYERSRCSGNFMYLAELCCSPVVVWILVEKRDSSPSSEGEQRVAECFMRQQVQSCPCLAGSKTSHVLDNTCTYVKVTWMRVLKSGSLYQAGSRVLE